MPEPPGLTAPVPQAFEFILQEPGRPDPGLGINPLAVPRKYLLRAVLSEEFDDNVRLDPGGQKKGDLSTIFSLVGMYRFESERSFLLTANSINARYSPSFSDRRGFNFINLNIAGGHQVTPRFSIGASESFVRSNDILQSDFSGVPTAFASGARGGRSEFSTNSFSPAASYRLAERTTLRAGWTNTVVIREGADQGTGSSTMNTFGGSIDHQFSNRSSGTLGYGHFINKSGTNSSRGDNVTAAVGYRLSPRTGLGVNGSVALRNPEEGIYERIYAFSVGVAREFSPTFRGAASVGFQRFEGGGESRQDPTFNVSVAKNGLRYRITATAGLATSESLGRADDIGQTRTWGASVTYDYFPSRFLLFSLGATYGRTDFSQAQRAELIGVSRATTDQFYALTAALTYRVARSLFVRLAYGLFIRDSSQPLRDTSNNRVILSIGADIAR